LYDRPTAVTEAWIEKRFASRKASLEANIAAFRAGWAFGETTELIDVQFRVPAAHDMEPGTYRTVNGTTAAALGLVAASVRSGLQIVFASYPITPASELLHELARHRSAGVRTIQAEDEIAAAGMALGAAFGGALGVTATSGPGMDLKAETIGLAVMLELPMLIIDVQRAGPSTGMPTKTEQSDLLMALYGRHGESPLPIVCACTPAQCFDAVLDSVRIAVRYRTPVILLSDLFLANSSEPWRLPDVTLLPKIDPKFATLNGGGPFEAYSRNADGARPWAVPGTPGLEHRIGGIEKSQPGGGISYEADNHQFMTDQRRERIAGIEVAPLVLDADDDAELLVLGWGSSFGTLRAAVRRLREAGKPIAHAQFHNLNPLPANTAEVLGRYKRVLVAEMNDGQLVRVLRAEFGREIESYAVTQGRPLLAAEMERELLERL
jgi:2-oxoglutarate ferredoxin oxidoreductase subunit alpha